MAILIEPPANWGNLQGKPTWLSDNQVSWEEIINRPISSFTLAGSVPGIRFTESDRVPSEKEWYLVVEGGYFGYRFVTKILRTLEPL